MHDLLSSLTQNGVPDRRSGSRLALHPSTIYNPRFFTDACLSSAPTAFLEHSSSPTGLLHDFRPSVLPRPSHDNQRHTTAQHAGLHASYHTRGLLPSSNSNKAYNLPIVRTRTAFWLAPLVVVGRESFALCSTSRHQGTLWFVSSPVLVFM